VAEGLAARALVLICYPLHPPGKPEKLRVDHFPRLDVPCLFISGTRDQFGTPAEFEQHLPSIPGDVTVHWIEGKDHALRNADQEIVDTVVAWLGTLR
jgi:predicted alpha/beta-hydrolase family hydrolase